MKFRKVPVVIDAVQFTGDNAAEIQKFTGADTFCVVDDEHRQHSDDCPAKVFDVLHNTWVGVYAGQWIIRGVSGEFYPCAYEVFSKTYEPAT